jgi:hypothetical protein
MVYVINAVHYGWSPSDKGWIDDLIAWITAGALIGLYWAGYQSLVRQRPHSPGAIVVPALPLLLTAFLTIPYDSTDVFLYMDSGWAQAAYGANPYTTVLREIPGIDRDPMIRQEWMQANKNPWLDLPFVYGFLLAHLAKAIAWAGNGNWWLTLALFKLINVAAYGATAFVLFSLAAKLKFERPDVVLYLFMWSPLVLLHHIANAHNDLFMGFLIVAGVWFVAHQRGGWAPAVLVAATLVKYVAVLLIPGFLYFIARTEGMRRMLAGVFGAAVLGCALSLPYAWDITRFRFDLMAAQLNKVTAGSMFSFFFYVYRAVTRVAAPLGSLESFGNGLRILLWVVSAMLILREARRFIRAVKPGVEDLVRLSSWILFVVIFIGSTQFYSWYIGMLFPLALLLRETDRLRQFVVLLSATHVLSLTSLSRKGIGYFAGTTGSAAGWFLFSKREQWKLHKSAM